MRYIFHSTSAQAVNHRQNSIGRQNIRGRHRLNNHYLLLLNNEQKCSECVPGQNATEKKMRHETTLQRGGKRRQPKTKKVGRAR